ncbi:MFS transporter [Aspergillus ambiguus]|uniref:MFS transporter n=1 Tax=Aspergillus ambiguus TaxID=176160 RepID=UPI003CCDBAAE
MSIVSQGLMPRAKFMKIMLFILLSTCVSASLCCLTVYCAVKARQHNTPSNAPDSVKNGFSSDACAVSAIWLIVMIWASNTLRAWRPMELQDPMVAFSIFSSVTITRAGTFVTVDEGLTFITRLLKGFMIGFAIATGISLFIMPITSRGNVFHDVKAYVAQIETVLHSQIAFVEDGSEVLTGRRGLLSRTRTALSMRDLEHTEEQSIESKKKRLAGSITKLNALHGKLQSDLFYSKDEIAWGKLSAKDLNRIGGLLRSILLPLSGIAMLPEILDMIVQHEGKRDRDQDDEESVDEVRKNDEIQKVVETLQRRLGESAALVKAGLQYVLLTLELMKPKQFEKKRKDKDEESRGEELNPLQSDFVLQFDEATREYYARRSQLPRALASVEAFSATEKAPDGDIPGPDTIATDPDVRQEFFIILYTGHLQENLLRATLDLVKFAEGKVADGTMKRGRLIFPKQKSIREWLSPNTEKKESTSVPDRRQSTRDGAVAEDIEPGNYPDPEHMPPANIWERSSTVLRTISHVIKSEQSLFGFRVAAASLSVGILAFLHQTQDFFIRQRCIWAMIVIVIGMNPTSGQTMFGFVARIIATVFALALSLVVWYIVDGKTPGVIIFLYIANIFGYYFWIKVPQYFGASVIAIVTLNVIIGYELQVRKLGIETATSNGQPYYPIYLFGPYKLAAVAAGCAISFFWVIFPYPITAKSTLRKAIGRGLFVLAKFYSCMHTTVELWLSGTLGNVQDVRSESYRLETARHKVFKEEMMLLNQLRMHSHFSTFEPPIGGKFPKHVYDAIISEIQRMLTSMALMAQTTQNLNALTTEHHDSQDPENKWVSRLAEIALQSADFKSHSTTSLLCHLSASILNAQPLPPYLSAGGSFPLARQLQRIDGELLSIRHVEDPAFSAFVSLEVLRSVLSFSLRDLLSNVKSLVGELAFDFHVRHADDYTESTRLMVDSHED